MVHASGGQTMSSFKRNKLVFGVCFVCSFTGAAWADQIVLKNGDRVTGTIIRKDGKDLTIKATNFGLITTAWDQVESISADKPLTVVLQNGNTVQGTLATTDGKVGVVTQSTRLNVTPAEITTIRDAEEQ